MASAVLPVPSRVAHARTAYSDARAVVPWNQLKRETLRWASPTRSVSPSSVHTASAASCASWASAIRPVTYSSKAALSYSSARVA